MERYRIFFFVDLMLLESPSRAQQFIFVIYVHVNNPNVLKICSISDRLIYYSLSNIHTTIVGWQLRKELIWYNQTTLQTTFFLQH